MRSEQALTERFQVRFSLSEADALRGIAERTGRPVSDIIRWATTSFLIITDSRLSDVLKPLRDIDPNARLIDVLKPLRDIDPDIPDVDQDNDDAP